MEFTKFALTDKFDRAFALAASLHRDQKRKNIPAPFMVHLMSVAALVAENIGFFPMPQRQCRRTGIIFPSPAGQNQIFHFYPPNIKQSVFKI